MNVQFLTDLDTREVDDSRSKLLAPFIAMVDDRSITVPAGYETDFASVPRLPFAYWLVGNTAKKSAVLHDYLYSTGELRKRADLTFRAAMRAEGVPAWRRFLMYAAVRLFGGTHHADRAVQY